MNSPEDTTDVAGIRGRSQASLNWYNRTTAKWWLVVSIVFLIVIVLELFGPSPWRPALFWFDWFLSLAFLADYVLRLYMAPIKKAFILEWWNLFDLFVVSMPFVSLFVVHTEAMGVFRMARAIRLVGLIRVPMLGARAVRLRRQDKRKQQLGLAFFVFVAVIVVAWFVVWKFETTHGGAIDGPFDALWWAVVTMFTVGYGDLSPKSPEGKIGAIFLMAAGVTLFSWVTATVATLFVDKDLEGELESENAKLRDELEQVRSDLSRIEALLNERLPRA